MKRVKNTNLTENRRIGGWFFGRFKFIQPTTYNLQPTRSGFTLIEILIVVAITSLLSGMVLTYSARGRNQVALYVESAKLAQVVLRAKSLAIATYNSSNTPCAYGMRIDFTNRSYALFGYKPIDCSNLAGNSIDPQAYNIIESFALQTGIDFKDAKEGTTLEYVLFVPPDPTTYIWGRDAFIPIPDDTGQVVLGSTNSGDILKISVSSAGQISF